MFVLDTNVIAELRRAGDGRADAGVVAWLSAVDAACFYISAVTLMEIELGVLRLERRDAARGALLRAWLEERILPIFPPRTLAVDVKVARCCARLHGPDTRPERDALIAATALVHGMTVVTRNVSDFAPTGVPVVNPWGGLADRQGQAAELVAGRARNAAADLHRLHGGDAPLDNRLGWLDGFPQARPSDAAWQISRFKDNCGDNRAIGVGREGQPIAALFRPAPAFPADGRIRPWCVIERAPARDGAPAGPLDRIDQVVSIAVSRPRSA